MRPEGAMHLLVIGHGASTNMRHATLAAISESLAEQGIATFRYNLPYSEKAAGEIQRNLCCDDQIGGKRGAQSGA